MVAIHYRSRSAVSTGAFLRRRHVKASRRRRPVAKLADSDAEAARLLGKKLGHEIAEPHARRRFTLVVPLLDPRHQLATTAYHARAIEVPTGRPPHRSPGNLPTMAGGCHVLGCRPIGRFPYCGTKQHSVGVS